MKLDPGTLAMNSRQLDMSVSFLSGPHCLCNVGEVGLCRSGKFQRCLSPVSYLLPCLNSPLLELLSPNELLPGWSVSIQRKLL